MPPPQAFPGLSGDLLKFTLLWERASIRWLLMRAFQKELQVFTETIQIRSFVRSTSQYYICQLFLSQMREIFTSWPRFPETSRLLPKISRRLPNVAENVRTYFEDVWALPKLLTRALISLEHKNDTKSSFNAFLYWIFLFLSCVKEEFVRICESGVRNCPWCVRSMSLDHTRETHA